MFTYKYEDLTCTESGITSLLLGVIVAMVGWFVTHNETYVRILISDFLYIHER